MPAPAIIGLGGVIAANIVLWLSRAATSIVGYALIGLGIGAITAVGVGVAVNAALSVAMSSFSSSGGQVAAFLSDVGVTWFIATLFSAVTTRMTLKGLTSAGNLSFWALRRTIS
jgi:hypothetical protein